MSSHARPANQRGHAAPFRAIFAALAGVLLGTATLASAQEGQRVQEIEVRYVGNQTVSPDRIRSQMSTKVGSTLSLNQLDEDVRSLYASGDVENVQILSENVSGGVKVIVVVQSRALYGGSEIVGNTIISDSRLARKIDLRVNRPIDEGLLQTARNEMQDMYRKQGFSEATVTYRIGPPSAEGYSTVVFTVNEGTQGVLRNVEFVGNNAFPASKLKEQMSQKERSIMTMFGGGGSTDPETLAQDVRAIEDFYRDNGYLNARVVNVSRVRVDAKHVDVVMTIDEGQTYQVESLAIVGVTVLDLQNDILPFLKTKAGSTFAGGDLKDDLKHITDLYGARGYADARVVPRLEEAGGGVKVVLDVTEGRPYRIGQIHIEGNTKTQDHVIRRELPLEPGQPFDTTRTDVTKRRLENMNYFSSVELMPMATSYIDEKDLLIRVAEKPTGTINVGAGFSSIDNLTGFLEITQANFDIRGFRNNFTGAGQRARLSLRGGSERVDASVSFTEPWFMGHRLAFTTEAYYRDLKFLSTQYDQRNIGASFSLRKSLAEFTYGSVGYRIERIDIDPTARATQAFIDEGGEFTKSSIDLSVTRDTRDNIFLPREGHRVTGGFEFIGLGGDVTDTIFSVTGAQHFALPFDSILNVQGRYRRSADGDHLFTRHFLGGANDLRGFSYRAVGPKDPLSGEVLGGNQAWDATVELTVPVVDKIRAALFYDVGEVSDGPVGTVGGGVNSNWGIGARLFILGSAPVRLDYAFPLETDAFNDGGGRFQFTMGAVF